MILISPAKSLDFETSLENNYPIETPVFRNESLKLIKKLKKLSPEDIKDLMHVSEKIAELNYKRFQEFDKEYTAFNAKPSIYAFKGDVYLGLDIASLSENQVWYAQFNLRILSGLYGLLKPLDFMQAYRLEMGTKFKYSDKINNLYQFWGEKITEQINSDCKKSDSKYIFNLASNEYFKSVKKDLLELPLVDFDFKDCKNGKYKIISFFAKKARGFMAKYIIENEIKDIEALKSFNTEGYYFSEEESTNNKLVFLREENK